MPQKIFFSVLLLLSLFFLPFAIRAENTNPWGIAYYVVIDDPQVNNGNLVALENGTYRLTRRESDPFTIGVVNTQPSLSVDQVGRDDSYPIVTTGQAYLLVGNSNGAIEPGDYVTSSSKPGIGMKSDGSGIVVGQALESFNSAAVGAEGLILVAVNTDVRGNNTAVVALIPDDSVVGKIREALVSLLNLVERASGVSPNDAFKYLLAAIIIIIALTFSYFTFVRVAQSGVEAVGRNPLARRAIMVSVVFNVIISLGIMLSGLLISYYIIRF